MSFPAVVVVGGGVAVVVGGLVVVVGGLVVVVGGAAGGKSSKAATQYDRPAGKLSQDGPTDGFWPDSISGWLSLS